MKSYNKIIQEIVKDALAHVKEKTVMKFVSKDVSYLESSKKRAELEEQFTEIEKGLSQEVKETISAYLDAIDENNSDTCDLYYLAGLTDAFSFLDSYGFINMKFN